MKKIWLSLAVLAVLGLTGCQADFSRNYLAGCQIKGNINTEGEKVYHLPECFGYDQIGISQKQRERYFCTEAEAQQAGFRKSNNCPSDNGCQIKGNINGQGDKIYHLPQCLNYDNITINLDNGDSWFCSEAEALQAGWKKSNNCPDI